MKGKYTFDHWTPTFSDTATETVTYVAEYNLEAVTYRVQYKDWDGTVLSETNVSYEDIGTVTAPADPTRAADASNTYTFRDWQLTTNTESAYTIWESGGSDPAVTADIVYTARYDATPINYTIKYTNFSDTDSILGNVTDLGTFEGRHYGDSGA